MAVMKGCPYHHSYFKTKPSLYFLRSVAKDEDETIGLLKDEVITDEKLAGKLFVGVIGVSIPMSDWKKE